ncbi:MAG: Smr/MutS family protein [Alphaproteobacteria bacterium]|nr:Smr/MutS family protein [Alphaproteobacteria bacterium]
MSNDEFKAFFDTVRPLTKKHKGITPALKTKKEFPAPHSKKIAPPHITPSTHHVKPRILENSDPTLTKKIKALKIKIEASLDLHGHTAAEAEEMVFYFLSQSVRKKMRCVLIITGKGENNLGILRKSLPQWCCSPRLSPLVVQVSQAHQNYGGSGAFYVILRAHHKI